MQPVGPHAQLVLCGDGLAEQPVASGIAILPTEPARVCGCSRVDLYLYLQFRQAAIRGLSVKVFGVEVFA